MPTQLGDATDEQLLAAIREHGSKEKAAAALRVAPSTFKDELGRRSLSSSPAARGGRRRPAPRLTRDSLHEALQPPNTCKVRVFLELLDEENREIVDEALGYDKRDFSSASVRNWLIAVGFSPDEVPGTDAINDHRAGRRPCRCRG